MDGYHAAKNEVILFDSSGRENCRLDKSAVDIDAKSAIRASARNLEILDIYRIEKGENSKKNLEFSPWVAAENNIEPF